MKYLLKKSNRGVGSFTVSTEIDVNEPVLDFCWTHKGAVFITATHIGLASKQGVKYPYFRKEFQEANGISYSPFQKKCFMSANNGSSLYEVSLATKSIDEVADPQKMKNYICGSSFKNTTDFAFDKTRTYYWANESANQIFCIRGDEVAVTIGCGKPGYSSSSRLTTSLLYGPSGICLDNDVLYVVEKGNRCIRKVKDGVISLFAGNPQGDSDFNAPTKIVKINNSFFVLDKNDIKSVFQIRKKSTIQKIYTGKNIVSIDTNKDKNLLVLERGD